MAKFRDRTEDFRDAFRQSAISLGLSQSKTAKVLASFIIHKPRERTSFMKAALRTLERIEALQQFLMKHKKDYVDLHRSTEEERDSIENEVLMFIKACKDHIHVLKNMITDEDANSKSWLGIKGDHKNADTIAHKHGMVLILSENLVSVTSNFDKLRAVRFQGAINRVTPRIKRKQTEIQQVPLKAQDQILDDETRILQARLSSFLDVAEQTEANVLELSALNHLKSALVSQQAQQIEHLYDQAVEATRNVELGNKELSEAIQRNSSSRTFLKLFLYVLSFSILFLHWY